MKVKDLLDSGDLFVKCIELTTDLTREQILNADALEVREAGEKILSYIQQSNKKVVQSFSFEEIDYEIGRAHV